MIKLVNEIFTDMFCSAPMRPEGCSKGMNLCCLLCDDRHMCIASNRNRSVVPCSPEHFDDEEKCEFLS
jgi:hypothetical protein